MCIVAAELYTTRKQSPQGKSSNNKTQPSGGNPASVACRSGESPKRSRNNSPRRQQSKGKIVRNQTITDLQKIQGERDALLEQIKQMKEEAASASSQFKQEKTDLDAEVDAIRSHRSWKTELVMRDEPRILQRSEPKEKVKYPTHKVEIGRSYNSKRFQVMEPIKLMDIAEGTVYFTPQSLYAFFLALFLLVISISAVNRYWCVTSVTMLLGLLLRWLRLWFYKHWGTPYAHITYYFLAMLFCFAGITGKSLIQALAALIFCIFYLLRWLFCKNHSHRYSMVAIPKQMRKSSADNRPVFDRGVRAGDNRIFSYEVYLLVEQDNECRFFKNEEQYAKHVGTRFNPMVGWWAGIALTKFWDTREHGLTNLHVSQHMLSIALNRKTIMAPTMRTAMERCRRMMMDDPSAVEDYDRLLQCGRSVYQDTALVAATILSGVVVETAF